MFLFVDILWFDVVRAKSTFFVSRCMQSHAHHLKPQLHQIPAIGN